ncbi:hypothetical protein NH340_JMT04337 [Sarcoptes scabiei]|nr:hypothetical protein NH340_JMT04337 [Sarcoptes scabiei]
MRFDFKTFNSKNPSIEFLSSIVNDNKDIFYKTSNRLSRSKILATQRTSTNADQVKVKLEHLGVVVIVYGRFSLSNFYPFSFSSKFLQSRLNFYPKRNPISQIEKIPSTMSSSTVLGHSPSLLSSIDCFDGTKISMITIDNQINSFS